MTATEPEQSGGLTRRHALRGGAGVLVGLGIAPAFWRTGRANAALPVTPGNGPYGELGPADANGIMLPQGFSSKVVAQGHVPVAGTGYVWHDFSDGAATFATPDGGWILVNNSETLAIVGGGASAIRFNRSGAVTDAYRILGDTSANCAGGRTPWGTWLSCEETDDGRVWECDPTGARPAQARLALGRFSHEAAAVDPEGQAVYLTEDQGDGGLYRFTPDDYPDLAKGRLDVAVVAADGQVSWAPVPDPSGGAANPTRKQVEGMTQFKRGEGIWFDAGVVYVATTSDAKVHALDTRAQRITVVYDKDALPDPPLLNPDNLTVSASGDIFVGEDSGDPDPLDLGIITPEGEVARFLKLTGTQHGSGEAISEVTGPVFDPSGTRLYFSSQRAFGLGQVYEIAGPFRQKRSSAAPIGGSPALATPVPAIGLEIPRRRTRRVLLRRGIPVGLTLDQAAQVTVTATATLRIAGQLRTVRLGRLSRDLDRGPEQMRLKLSKRGRDRIGDRRRLKIIVEVAIRSDGVTRRQRRTLSIRP